MTVSRKKSVACGAGLVVLDLLLTDEIGAVTAYAGGTCGNVLLILSYLGWLSYPIARIGEDAIGQKLRRDLRRWGLSEDLLTIDAGVQTPVIVQQNRRLTNGGVSHRFIWQCPHCGTYLPMFRPPTRVAAAGLLNRLSKQDLFFFDRVAPATVLLAEASASRGALVVFEPQKAGRDALFERAVNAAHIVKYSRERIQVSPVKGSTRPWLEIQTLGREGLRFRIYGARWNRIKAIEVAGQLRDTSGSGDWTSAGIIHRLVSERVDIGTNELAVITRAMRFGQALAAINCGFDGARGTMYALTARQTRNRAERLLRGELSGLKSAQRLGIAQDRYVTAFCGACISTVRSSSIINIA